MAPSIAQQAPFSFPLSSTHESFQLTKQHPELLHTLNHGSTVLALAVSSKHGCIFAGTQDGEIVAWSLATFHCLEKTQAHRRSILSLSLSADESLLFSTAGDPIINVWCPKSLQRIHEIYSTYDVGDVFCTAFSQSNSTLYIGAQNATIQWIVLNDASAQVASDSSKHPNRRNHRFFDSKAVFGGTSTPRRNEDKWKSIPDAGSLLEIDSGCTRKFAHNGYVYCMLVASGPTVQAASEDEVLISGGGDGTIRLWKLEDVEESTSKSTNRALSEISVLGAEDAESVLSLALDGSFLYAGKLDGVAEVWDLDTSQKLRVIKAHDTDIMSLHMGWGYLWTTSGNGTVAKYNIAHYGQYQNSFSDQAAQKYQCLARWTAHQGKILTSSVTNFQEEQYFITGANDCAVRVWSFEDSACASTDRERKQGEIILETLRDFVSYKTVSSRPEYAEDCRKGATFLGALLKRLGGQVELLCSDKAHNPVVYALFSGKKESSLRRKRIMFYGHYDVVPADNKNDAWNSNPFTLVGKNGFLYGRGVSDNKGPIIAALYAVTDLMLAQRLENDIVFLIEGEEESGSKGFAETVKRNKELIGHIDYILLANSYWLDDEVPCLTYGLRGVLHATISVSASRPDMHSGVDGSHLIDEPLSDLTAVISKLKGPRNKVNIPGFYDNITPVTSQEDSLYDEIVSMLTRRSDQQLTADQLKQSLMARWREPNLTIHRFKVSGPEGSLVSGHASAHISFRLVPHQEFTDVISNLSKFVEDEFKLLESQNSLFIQIDNQAEPWLGDPNNAIFRTLEAAILEAWPRSFEHGTSAQQLYQQGQASPAFGNLQNTKPVPATPKPKKPLYIREGGSIPAIRFLEKEFGAPAAHLPCGRASDSAHLDNERMSMINLHKAREIFGKVFERL